MGVDGPVLVDTWKRHLATELSLRMLGLFDVGRKIATKANPRNHHFNPQTLSATTSHTLSENGDGLN